MNELQKLLSDIQELSVRAEELGAQPISDELLDTAKYLADFLSTARPA